MSFLNDNNALAETLNLLKKRGCKDDSIAAFQKAVKHYYSTPLSFNLSKFPQEKNGYYNFQTMPQLVAVLPPKLWFTQHPFEFNCFDTVIILGNGKFTTSLYPDNHSVDFLPAGVLPNGDLICVHAPTAKDAFNFSYSPSYQNVSSSYIPSSTANARINLVAALYCFHELTSFTNQDIGKHVLGILQTSWKNQGITFPSDAEIVLCHQINLSKHLIATTHAGILFPDGNRYCYLEKDGGRGPYIRLNFSDRADLLIWLASHFEKASGDYVLATFNDSKVETLNVGLQDIGE